MRPLLLLFHFFLYASSIILHESRRACKEVEIVYIPDEPKYYEEGVEMLFDSSKSMNHIPITRIVEDECVPMDAGFEIGGSRPKRSVVGRGVRHLSKLLLHLFQKGKNLLKPQLFKQIETLVKSVTKSQQVAKRGVEMAAFWYLLWKDPSAIRNEVKDDNFEEMLEKAFRGSLQMLRETGHLTEMLLHFPTILKRIRRRLPVDNALLLSMVTAEEVYCDYNNRDTQVAFHFKLRIPKTEQRTIQMCDDIGVVINRSYQFFELPMATFSTDKTKFKVDIEKCSFQNPVFCPNHAFIEDHCSVDSIENCVLKTEHVPSNFYRNLVVGFAVYGDFKQVIAKKETASEWRLRPHFLYHLVPRSGEQLLVGDKVLQQDTRCNETVVRQVL